nr:hypothetical protein Saspl_052002 [Ipomoea trifida]GLL21582.1 hypothetical protein Saspl_052002 [Ipomoea trifida]GMC58535.1 hypothetical protein Saspl_052002 [Ipomoea batatas]GMC74674.1 hypothetical protein Saspl_052002 [Ipomoea batatas]GMD93515.1 hypothetical protein Saspl_052002 [Ipomoea batatas]
MPRARKGAGKPERYIVAIVTWSSKGAFLKAFVISYSKADLDSFPWTRHQSKQAGHGRHEVLQKKEQGTPHSIKQEPKLRAGQMKSTNRV